MILGSSTEFHQSSGGGARAGEQGRQGKPESGAQPSQAGTWWLSRDCRELAEPDGKCAHNNGK